MTSTVLYGCEAWTLKDPMKRRLRAVQRKMLRMVLGSRRRLIRADDDKTISSDSLAAKEEEDEDGSQYELEPWTDFLKRVTHLAEERATAAGLREWLTTWRSRQWRWAQKVVRDDRNKWSQIVLQWQPQLHASRSSARAQSRPKKKWSDEIHGYLNNLGVSQPWEDLAQDSDIWSELEAGFLKWGVPLSKPSA